MDYGKIQDENLEKIILAECPDAAVGEFISRVEKRLKAMGRVLFKLTAAETEDLMEETILLFCEKRAALLSGGLKSWFFHTMANKCMNYCRGRTRFGRFRERMARERGGMPGASYASDVLVFDLEKAMHGLSQTERKLVYNLFFEGTTPKELARDMGVTTRAMQIRKANTLRKLRERMEGAS